MRIVFVASGLGQGGAERQLVQLAGGLADSGHEVHLLATRGGPYRQIALERGIHVAVVERKGVLGGVRSKLALARLVAQIDPQIVHPYLTSTNTWLTLCRPFLGKRWLVWGVRDSGTDPSLYGQRACLVFKLARLASRRADLIVANSLAGARNYAAVGYPADRIVVIPNGIDTDTFCPSATARDRTRAEWCVGPSDCVVGMLARFDPVKGHDDFVAAAQIVQRSMPSATFVIAGDHSAYQRCQLEFRAHAAGVILVVLPEQVRPQDFLNGIDVFVMPSQLAEGFPNVVGEALACGCTVVTTDVGDSRLLVEGRGLVVPPSQPDLLARAIAKAAAGLPDRESAAERRRFIVEHYSIDRLVSRSEAVFDDLIAGDELRIAAP